MQSISTTGRQLIIIFFISCLCSLKLAAQVGNPSTQIINQQNAASSSAVSPYSAGFIDEGDSASAIPMFDVIERSDRKQFSSSEISSTNQVDKTKVLSVCSSPGPSYCAGLYNKKGTLKLLFHAGGDKLTYEQGQASGQLGWSASVPVTLVLKDPAGTTLPSASYSLGTLTISDIKPELLYTKDITTFFPDLPGQCQYGTNQQSGKLATIECIIGNGTISGNVSSGVVRLDVWFEQELGVDMSGSVCGNPQTTPLIPDWFTNAPKGDDGGIVEGNPVTFRWHSRCANDSFPNYQVQILRLYNINRDYVALQGYNATFDYFYNEGKVETVVDWSKALTLETGSQKQEITLTLPEGRGFYIWRVRPVGNKYPGGTRDLRNLGCWTTASTGVDPTITYDLTDVANPAAWDHAVFFYSGFDEEKNWQYQRAFAENSSRTLRAGENIVFSDGLLKSTQHQSKIQSKDSVLIGQIVYDFSGRPSLTSLNAPIAQNKLEYKPTLLTPDGSTSLYKADNFDTDAKQLNPDKISDVNSELSKYFSNNNPDISIPNAEGYPYTRTLFYPDGRVKEQSGVGSAHKIGSGHTVKTYYSSVSERELVSIFGDEAPADSSCYKVISVDENNAASVAYYSDGFLIATCLIDNGELKNEGGSTINNYLTTDPSISRSFIKPPGEKINVSNISETLTKGTASGNVLRTSKTITVLRPTTLNLAYYIHTKAFRDACLNYCSTCDYVVKIRIVKADDPQVNYVPEFTSAPFSPQSICPISNDPNNYILANETTIALGTMASVQIDEANLGTFIIEKVVMVHNSLQSIEQPNNTAVTMAAENIHVRNALAPLPSLSSILSTILSGTSAEQQLASYKSYRTGLANQQTPYAYLLSPTCKQIILPEVFCTDESGCAEEPQFEEHLLKAMCETTFDDKNKDGRKDDGEYYFIDTNRNGIKDPAESYVSFKDENFNGKKDPFEDYTFGTDGTGAFVTLNEFFKEYGKNPFVDKYPAMPQYTRVNNLPAYKQGRGAFNQLIKNMIAADVPNDNLYWTCEDLWKCWQGIVGQYQELGQRIEGNTFDLVEAFLGCTGRKLQGRSASRYGATGYLDHAYKYFEYDNSTKAQECAKGIFFDNSIPPQGIPDPQNNGNYTSSQWLELHKCLQSTVTTISRREDANLPDGYECKPPTQPYDSNHPDDNGWADFIACQKKMIERMQNECRSDCERLVPDFREKLRAEYAAINKYIVGERRPFAPYAEVLSGQTDAVELATVYCQIEAFVNACSQGCTLNFIPPAGPAGTVAQRAEFKKRKAGRYEFQLAQSGACTGNDFTYSTKPGNKLGLLIQHLNARYEAISKTLQQPQAWDFGNEAKTFLLNNGFSLPSCLQNYNGFMSVVISPGLSGRFRKAPETVAAPCSTCTMWFEVEEFATTNWDDALNEYVDAGWGKSMNSIAVSDTSTTMHRLMSDDAGDYYLHAPMPNIGADSLRREAERLMDSAVFLGVNGMDSKMPAFILPDSLGNYGNSMSGVISSRITDLYSIHSDTLAQSGLWKAYGTISIQMPRLSLYDPVEMLRVRLVASSDTGKLQAITLIQEFGTSADTVQRVTTLSMEEFRQLADKPFTQSIGKFSVDNEGYLVYENLVAAEIIRFKGVRYYRKKIVKVDCDFSPLCEAYSCGGVCLKWNSPPEETVTLPEDKITTFRPKSCAQQQVDEVKRVVTEAYNRIRRELEESVREAYDKTCSAENFEDRLVISYQGPKTYHYTLYYYDRAGRLVKTVPPAGIDFTATSRAYHPDHKYVTEYEYNSQGQVVRRKSPDGGDTYYYYNSKGQLRFSQDAEQKISPVKHFSYSRYDGLGRLIETGLLVDDNALSNIDDMAYPSNAANCHDVNKIVYSTPASLPSPYAGLAQQNLRNRISMVSYYKNANIATHRTESYYSYDPHGNIEWMVQDIGGYLSWTSSKIGASKVDYEYDLSSGNVTKIKYQDGKADRFYWRYGYDEDNRLKTVETSRDNQLWEQDANYSYYGYGPLRRVVVGEDSVQGTDYTYTLQGWLKGINHPALDGSSDPGNDGQNSPNSAMTSVGRDAYGMILGYFDGDFKRYYGGNQSKFNSSTGNGYTAQAHNLNAQYQLFNGNITSWTNNTQPAPGGTPGTRRYEHITGSTFRYDILNRLYYDDFQLYTPGGSPQWSPTPDYSSTYIYNTNGNLDQLVRRTYQNIPFDGFQYYYQSSTNPANPTNRLDYVSDWAGNASWINDIKSGTQAQVSGNYGYYANGRLKSDAQENLEIEWNVYGKVSQITNTDNGTIIRYTYDAMRRPVLKEVTNAPLTAQNKVTYYYYDAGGQLLATYDEVTASNSVYTLGEFYLSGMSRLGTAFTPDPNQPITRSSAAPDPNQDIFIRYIDRKQYELTDHLGNVRAVIGDKKLVQTGGAPYFIADLKSYANYYPYGMQQPERCWTGVPYRYGYNGMEMDNAVKGERSNSYTTDFRQYDPRLGKWWSEDPIVKPWESPYAAMANNPIVFADPSGLQGENSNEPKRDEAGRIIGPNNSIQPNPGVDPNVAFEPARPLLTQTSTNNSSTSSSPNLNLGNWTNNQSFNNTLSQVRNNVPQKDELAQWGDFAGKINDIFLATGIALRENYVRTQGVKQTFITTNFGGTKVKMTGLERFSKMVEAEKLASYGRVLIGLGIGLDAFQVYSGNMTLERFGIKTLLVVGTMALTGPIGLGVGLGITAADLIWGDDFDNFVKESDRKSAKKAIKAVQVRMQQEQILLKSGFIHDIQDNNHTPRSQFLINAPR